MSDIKDPESDKIAYPSHEEYSTNEITHKSKFFVAVAAFVVVITYLGFTAFQSASSYYMTVGEVLEKGDMIYDKSLRVNGKLVHDSFERESLGATMHFAITDGQDEIDVTYGGLVPDLFFNEHSEIMLEGEYSREGIFETDTIIVKCPSKYQAVEESA